MVKRNSNVLGRAVASTAASMLLGRVMRKGMKKAATRSVVNRIRRKKRAGYVARRRGTRETDVPAAEYTKQSVALGRKPRKTLRSVWKLVNQNLSSTIYGYRNYSQFGGQSGALALGNTSTSASTGTLVAPCNLWEITSAPNVVNGAVTSPNWMWYPTWSDPTGTGTLTWQNAAYAPVVENSDLNSTLIPQYPIQNDTLDWVSAKMIFYCPLQVPCRFQIDVIQLKDTRLVPDTGTQTGFASAFWQAQLKRFMQSPLETGDTKYNKYIKRLYTNSFILNPKESTEIVNTIFREVNLFLRLNRRVTYDWNDSDGMGMLGVDGQRNTGADLSMQVHPRARIYLMIRAQARNGTAWSSTVMPSYDLVLRTKHSQLSA